MAMGKGAIVSCYARMLYPSTLINQTFPHMNRLRRMELLLVLRKEKKINQKKTICLVVQSNEIMNGDSHIELYGAIKFFKIELEGPP
jgi:hypothetical protein